jgi:hypothetical protein
MGPFSPSCPTRSTQRPCSRPAAASGSSAPSTALSTKRDAALPPPPTDRRDHRRPLKPGRYLGKRECSTYGSRRYSGRRSLARDLEGRNSVPRICKFGCRLIGCGALAIAAVTAALGAPFARAPVPNPSASRCNGRRAGLIFRLDLGIMGANQRLRERKSSAREGLDRDVFSARAFGAALTKAPRVQRILCIG